ncbi:MAG: hypothetical protein NTV32_03090, partial [Gammaproteobacteria bacterium]|nr:hypothetical protein [Gammaproteobacteria bacterium]
MQSCDDAKKHAVSTNKKDTSNELLCLTEITTSAPESAPTVKATPTGWCSLQAWIDWAKEEGAYKKENSTSYFKAKSWSDWWHKKGAFEQAKTPKPDILSLIVLFLGLGAAGLSEVYYARYTLDPTKKALIQIIPDLKEHTAKILATIFSSADATVCTLMVGYLPGHLKALRDTLKKYKEAGPDGLKYYLIALLPFVIYSCSVGASSADEGLAPKGDAGIAIGTGVFVAQMYIYLMSGLTSALTGATQIKRAVSTLASAFGCTSPAAAETGAGAGAGVGVGSSDASTAEIEEGTLQTESANCILRILSSLYGTVDNPYIIPETTKTILGALIRAIGFGYIPSQWGKLFCLDMTKTEKEGFKYSSIVATLLMHFLTVAATSIEAAGKKATYFRMTPAELKAELVKTPNDL